MSFLKVFTAPQISRYIRTETVVYTWMLAPYSFTVFSESKHAPGVVFTIFLPRMIFTKKDDYRQELQLGSWCGNIGYFSNQGWSAYLLKSKSHEDQK